MADKYTNLMFLNALSAKALDALPVRFTGTLVFRRPTVIQSAVENVRSRKYAG